MRTKKITIQGITLADVVAIDWAVIGAVQYA